MKKLSLLFSLLAVLSFSQMATAQVDVTLNPLGALFGNLSVGADFMMAENFSIEGTLGYGSRGFGSGDDAKWTNIPVTAVGKYYFNPRQGADRFYLDAFVRYVNRSYNYPEVTSVPSNDYKVNRVGVGFGIGFKVVSAKGFVFDINAGAGRALVDNVKYKEENSTGFTAEDWINVMFQGKLGIGYRFGGDK